MSLPNRCRGGQTALVVYVVHMAALSVWSMPQGGAKLPWLSSRSRDDRGALTTEQAIITAALIGLAGLLVLAIGAVVRNKLLRIR